MKTARRYARELAMQGIFQWQFNRDLSIFTIENDLRDYKGFSRADSKFLLELLRGVVQQEPLLLAKIIPHYDCSAKEVKPVERTILLIGTYELLYYTDTPSRVILNEAIEIAKVFGGTDGYKFVNGVLDKLALAIRG